MWSALVPQGYCRVSLGKAGDNVTCHKDRADFGSFDKWREVPETGIPVTVVDTRRHRGGSGGMGTHGMGTRAGMTQSGGRGWKIAMEWESEIADSSRQRQGDEG